MALDFPEPVSYNGLFQKKHNGVTVKGHWQEFCAYVAGHVADLNCPKCKALCPGHTPQIVIEQDDSLVDYSRKKKTPADKDFNLKTWIAEERAGHYEVLPNTDGKFPVRCLICPGGVTVNCYNISFKYPLVQHETRLKHKNGLVARNKANHPQQHLPQCLGANLNDSGDQYMLAFKALLVKTYARLTVTRGVKIYVMYVQHCSTFQDEARWCKRTGF